MKYLIPLSSDLPCSWWKVRNHSYCFSNVYNMHIFLSSGCFYFFIYLFFLWLFLIFYFYYWLSTVWLWCALLWFYLHLSYLGFLIFNCSSKLENMWSWCLQIVLLSHVSLHYFCTVVRYILTWFLLFYRLMRHFLFFSQVFFSTLCFSLDNFPSPEFQFTLPFCVYSAVRPMK